MSSFVLPLLVALSSAQTVSVTISGSASQASAVSIPLDPSFAGMGIEPSNLYSFTGGANTNTLSVNLLQNLADYSGAPPHLRIGGNTGDYFLYDDTFTDFYVENNPSATGDGNIKFDSMIIGPAFWTALNRFPKNTPITFGLNMAYDRADYLDRIVGEAQACVNGLTNVKLKSFEIGNEPDLWLQNNFRNGTWNGQVYTEQWLARAQAVYQQVLKPLGISPAFFEPAATASTIGTTFEITQLVNVGITAQVDSSNSGYLAGWNQHDYFYFVGVSSFTLTNDYMLDMDNTNNQFAYWQTQVGIGLDTGLPYYLREMSSCGPIGLRGISDTFGASLWTLNFFLYAASVNISSVQMHMTDNSWAAPWQPILNYNLNPYVRPSYYAFAAMAQLIGNGNGTTQISRIANPTSIPSTYTTRVRMYAAYANGNLASIVLINSNPSSNSSTSTRGKLAFALSLPNNKGQTLYLSYLTNTGYDSLSGTTWNGLSYETSGDGTPTTVSSTVQTVKVDNSGKATITVQDTEAVIANFGSQLGSNTVVAPNTTAPAPSTRSTTHKSAATSTTGTSTVKTAVITSVVTSTMTNAPHTGGAMGITRNIMLCACAVFLGITATDLLTA